MKQPKKSQEFIDQALCKARERGDRTLQSVADELNMPLSTLKGWLRASAIASKGFSPSAPIALPHDISTDSWIPSQKLQALNESYGLRDEALHAWCRQKGLYAHQLQTWHQAFCAPEPVLNRKDQASLREMRLKHETLERKLARKDKALAEAAALLVLQKKFQALWEDEV